MTRLHAPSALVVVALAAACPPENGDPDAGANVFVIGDDAPVVSCDDDDDCPLGASCVGGACEVVDTDADNDGYHDDVDCEAENPAVHPAAAEGCDGVDNDCDGAVDEGVKNACGQCGAAPIEICNLADDDCDGRVDEECVGGRSDEEEPNDGALACQPVALPPAVGEVSMLAGSYSPAGDVDSYCFFARAGTVLDFSVAAQSLGSEADAVIALFDDNGAPLPGGYNDYANGNDPRLLYTFDADGNYRLDTYHFYDDAGGPSYSYELSIEAVALVACVDDDDDGVSSCDGDCRDDEMFVFPGQTEVCDGVDNDCDGAVDPGCPSSARQEVEPNETFESCELLSFPFTVEGVVSPRKDADTYCFFAPGDVEVTFDVDAAEPPFGSLLNSRLKLLAAGNVELARNDDGADPESGYLATDSDSYLAYVLPFPGIYAIQVSDESTLAGGSRLTYALAGKMLDPPLCTDGDSDGVSTCEGDCHDDDPVVHFGAPERCDDKDNDCDGVVDFAACTGDFDGDGFAGDDGDCDDGDPLRHPDRPEVCNGIDDDCDGETDEGVTNACGACGHAPRELCGDNADNDCDGVTDGDCDDDEDGDGFTSDTGGDCDDEDGAVHPGATELCNGKDDDCDGAIDEFVKNSCGLCAPEPEEVCDGLDNNCNGLIDDGALNACGTCGPAPLEVCDGDDDDCDGETDEGVTNACGVCGPLPAEACNAADDDCDGDEDEGCDIDLDGDLATPRQGDCDEADDEVRYGRAEGCDGKDNDCDGVVDEGCAVLSESEDNNTQAACDLALWPDRAHAGVIATGTDEDWWCFTIAVAGTKLLFDVDARDDGSPLDPRMQLYGSGGALLDESSGGGDDPDTGQPTVDPFLEHEFAAPGVYAVRISALPTTTAGAGAFYSLDARVTAGCLDLDRDNVTSCDGDCDDRNPLVLPGAVDVCDGLDNDCALGVDDRCVGDCLDDLYEPNGDTGSAKAVSPGTTQELTYCHGTSDYYKVAVGEGATLRAQIFFTHAAADLVLELLGTNGLDVLDSSQTAANNEEVEASALAAGTYFLRVVGPVDGDTAYELVVEVTQ